MDTTNVLTIIGIAATVLLGAWAIYLTVRYSRQVGIAYVEDTCLALIDDITQGIGDLEIRFRNSPVSQNIVLLKGYIINTGKRDISPAMVERRLRLVLPEGFEWIDCQVTDRSENLQAQLAEITIESIEFEFGLLKTEEYFRFDALATVPTIDDDTPKDRSKLSNVKLREVLEFDYRISDMHGIQKLRMSNLQTSSLIPPRMAGAISDQRLPHIFLLSNWVLSSFWMALFLIVFGVAFYFILSNTEAKRIAYEISGPDNETIEVNTRVKGQEIEVYNRDGFKKKLSPTQFNDLPKTTILRPQDVPFSIMMSSVYIGLGGLMLIAWAIRFVRTRKYRRILRLAEP